MELKTAKPKKTVCECDHFAPNVKHFCSVDEQETLARDYLFLEMSGPERNNWVVRELYDYRAGDLHDFEDKKLDFDKPDECGDKLLDRIFGAHPGRSMNRLTDRAKQRYRNVLDDEKNLRLRHLLYYYAVEVHRCRHEGRCSKPAKSD